MWLTSVNPRIHISIFCFVLLQANLGGGGVYKLNDLAIQLLFNWVTKPSKVSFVKPKYSKAKRKQNKASEK